MVTKLCPPTLCLRTFCPILIKVGTFLNGFLGVYFLKTPQGRQKGRQKISFVFSAVHPIVYFLLSITKKRI